MTATVGIVVFPGSNCEHDVAEAVTGLGATARLLWHGDRSVSDVDVLVLPGGFAHGDYLRPGAIARFFRFVRSNPVLTLPLWAFAVMFPMWWLKGRDPDPGISVAPMYEPPEQMGPAEVGTLIDGSVDPRDITSVLVDMAVRGYVKIVETQHKGFLSSTKD